MMIFKRIKSVFNVLFLRGSGILLGFLVQIILARLLGPIGAGVYYVFISWQNLSGNFFGGGFPMYVLRKVSYISVEKDDHRSWAYIINLIVQLLVYAVIIFLLLLYFVPDISSFFLSGTNLSSFITKTTLFYFIIINGFFIVLNHTMSAAFKGVGKPKTSIIVEFNLIPIFTIILLSFLFIFNITLSIIIYLCIYLFILKK